METPILAHVNLDLQPASRTIRTCVGSFPSKKGLVIVEIAWDSDSRYRKHLYLMTDVYAKRGAISWFEVIRNGKVKFRSRKFSAAQRSYRGI